MTTTPRTPSQYRSTRRDRFISSAAHRAIELGDITERGVLVVLGTSDFQWKGFRERDQTRRQETLLVNAIVRECAEIERRRAPLTTAQRVASTTSSESL
jgi:hypothetical protein